MIIFMFILQHAFCLWLVGRLVTLLPDELRCLYSLQ